MKAQMFYDFIYESQLYWFANVIKQNVKGLKFVFIFETKMNNRFYKIFDLL